MTQAVAQILAEVERLSPPEWVELTDRLVETLSNHVPREIERARIEEVRRRTSFGAGWASRHFRLQGGL